MSKRIIVGVTGASGAPLALRCLRALRADGGYEIHLIMTPSALLTISEECSATEGDFRALADRCYANTDTGAAVASGSFRCEGMLIVPCSMKTAAGIVSGYADSLLLRAADVTLKERRPLVLCPRETPMSYIHLRNLSELARLPEVRIVPPMMSWYTRPETIEDMETQAAARLLGVFGVEPEGYKRWND